MSHIEVIALICVYTLFLIIATIKLPTYVVTIKKQCKTRKIQKHKEQKDYIEKVVLNYLKKLQKDGVNETDEKRGSYPGENNPTGKTKEGFIVGPRGSES
jgi:Tfp pilus assembly major pilin PilA